MLGLTPEFASSMTSTDLEQETVRADVAEAAQEYLQSILDTGREPFVVLNRELRVQTANRAFYLGFQTDAARTVGHLVYELGDGQWDIPALRLLLEEIVPQNATVDNYEVTHNFPRIGSRTMLLNARKLYCLGNHTEMLLLAMEDVTERRALESRLQADLEKQQRIAQILQRPLLTETPEDAFPGLSVATLYSAAWQEAEVGGDFYDTLMLADGRVALVVGDVTGKGLAAAARATEAKDVLRAFLRLYPFYAASALTRLNDYYCDVQSLDNRSLDTILGLSLVLINVKNGEATFAWGGIEPPLVIRANGTVESVVGGGLLIGVMPHATYTEVTVRFRPGDTLMLSTDGLSEARQGKDFLGQEGVEELAGATYQEPTLRTMAEAILSGARTFAGGGLQDDACLVLARRL